jgi:carbonic anhydrase/acetyltransferase-like protein (isoleucine patch superfamily)
MAIKKLTALQSRIALYRLSRRSGVSVGTGVLVKGDRLEVVSKGRIWIGDDVVLNSRSEGYHANMPCGVKIICERPDAIIRIGARSRLNGACLHAWKQVSIGEGCLLAAGVQIFDSNGHKVLPEGRRTASKDEPRSVHIGNDVWLGLNVVVLPGTWIGDNVVVGANSVLRGEIPSNSIVRPSDPVIVPMKPVSSLP